MSVLMWACREETTRDVAKVRKQASTGAVLVGKRWWTYKKDDKVQSNQAAAMNMLSH